MESTARRKAIFGGLAVWAVIGMVIVIISCIMNNSYWPLLVVPVLLLAPVPNILASLSNDSPFATESDSTGVECAKFFTGMLGFSAFFLPFFFHHLNLIQLNSAILAFAGTIILSSAVVLFQYIFNPDSHDIY